MPICSKSTCPLKGQDQPVEQFNKSGVKGRLRSDCKTCQAEYNKAWRAAHPTYNQAYYQANLERMRRKNRLWRLANPDYGRIWYQQNKARHLALVQSWRARYPDLARSINARSTAVRRAREDLMDPMPVWAWYFLVRRYGECCLYPDCTTGDPIQIDHIVPLSRGGTNDLGNLQLLCRYHNLSKGNRTCVDYRPAI